MNTVDWLLDSDPAIRWQAMRDLTDASPAAVAAERARVPREGIGAEILACQGSDGAWHRADEPDWLPTLFTMQLLRATGVDRADPAVDSAVARLEAGFRWHEEFGAKPFFEGEVEPCINGGALALGALLRAPDGEPRAPSRRRAARGRRLELRSAEERALVVPHHHLRAGGAARVRACRRVRAGDRGGQTARRGVPARARPLPAALDRRGRESGVPDVRVPAPLPLRRPPCARLLQSRRCPARRAHGRSGARRREQAAGRRSMAPRSRARRGARLPRSASRWASRAGGTRSGRCACSVGTRDGRPESACSSFAASARFPPDGPSPSIAFLVSVVPAPTGPPIRLNRGDRSIRRAAARRRRPPASES